MDDGRITDSQGRTVDFKNTIIIMTSNVGSNYLIDGVTGDVIPETVRESVLQELRRLFRPEFLNRVDDTILFKPLTLKEIKQIVELLLKDLNKRLEDKKITVTLNDKAENWVAEKGYDPVYGARPLKRFFQKQMETKLARGIISGDIKDNSTIEFIEKNDELMVKA